MINMDLESTIVTINNLLKLDFESSFSDFIQPQKQLMAIPDYQREYKWEKSKIKTFVDNVMQRSKFLGKTAAIYCLQRFHVIILFRRPIPPPSASPQRTSWRCGSCYRCGSS